MHAVFIRRSPFSIRFKLIDASVNLLNGPEKCYSDFMLIRSRLIVNRLQKASSKDECFSQRFSGEMNFRLILFFFFFT